MLKLVKRVLFEMDIENKSQKQQIFLYIFSGKASKIEKIEKAKIKKFHFRDPYSYKLKRSVTVLVVRYSACRKLRTFRKVNAK